MKVLNRKTIAAALTLSVISSFGFSTLANAAAVGSEAKVKSTASSASKSDTKAGSGDTKSTTVPANVKAIIATGDANITKRLTSLAALSTKINGLEKVTPAEKAALTSEATYSTGGLTTLKTTLDADTTVAKAKSDSSLIFTDYRVYAIVIPKVSIIKAADDQLAKEDQLQAFQSLLVSSSSASQLQAENATLNDMKAKITASHNLSQMVDTNALALQPSDYNSNHKVLASYYANLKTAQADNVAAYKDGMSVVSKLTAQK